MPNSDEYVRYVIINTLTHTTNCPSTNSVGGYAGFESGMSQSEVGRQVGLSRSAVTQIKSGDRDVTADEVVRFSTIFRHSPMALLSGLGQGTSVSVGEKDEMLDDILRALPGQGLDSAELRSSLDGLFGLSRQLTEIESVLGVAVYGPQAFAFRGTSPRTHWEAAHQGYAVA